MGRHFRVTRERIRQIEAKALKKLRCPDHSRYLREYARLSPVFMDAVEYKIPVENVQYPEWSEYCTSRIGEIIKTAIARRENLIHIRTNLRRGLPLENINKVAGPFVEAWAAEQFERVAEQSGNAFELINVDVSSRLGMSDVILQFKHQQADGVAATYYFGQCGCESHLAGHPEFRQKSQHHLLRPYSHGIR